MWLTVSNAFFGSKNMTPFILPTSLFLYYLLVMSSKAVTVEWHGLNPCWELVRKFEFIKYSQI